MMRFVYKEWDEQALRKLTEFKQLLELFNYLLLKTHGNAGEALELMRYLQGRGLIDGSVDLDEFAGKLETEEIVRRDGPKGSLALTRKGVRGLRKSSLERVFRDLRAEGAMGDHRTPHGGGAAGEPLPEIREYAFGDDLRSIDFTESIRNSIRRIGSTDSGLEERDLVVRDTEFAATCATALLLDISHSMVL